MKFYHLICVVLSLHLFHCLGHAQRDLEPNQDVYTIEGRVFPPEGPISANSWYSQTRILANGGEFVGMLRLVLYLKSLSWELYCMLYATATSFPISVLITLCILLS